MSAEIPRKLILTLVGTNKITLKQDEARPLDCRYPNLCPTVDPRASRNWTEEPPAPSPLASEAREAGDDTADGEDFREDEDEVDDYGLTDPLVEVDDLCNQNRPVGVRFDSCHCRTVGIATLCLL